MCGFPGQSALGWPSILSSPTGKKTKRSTIRPPSYWRASRQGTTLDACCRSQLTVKWCPACAPRAGSRGGSSGTVGHTDALPCSSSLPLALLSPPVNESQHTITSTPLCSLRLLPYLRHPHATLSDRPKRHRRVTSKSTCVRVRRVGRGAQQRGQERRDASRFIMWSGCVKPAPVSAGVIGNSAEWSRLTPRSHCPARHELATGPPCVLCFPPDCPPRPHHPAARAKQSGPDCVCGCATSSCRVVNQMNNQLRCRLRSWDLPAHLAKATATPAGIRGLGERADFKQAPAPFRGPHRPLCSQFDFTRSDQTSKQNRLAVTSSSKTGTPTTNATPEVTWVPEVWLPAQPRPAVPCTPTGIMHSMLEH